MIHLKEQIYQNNARTSIAVINGKEIKTPFFMPVATKGAVRHITIKDLDEIGIKAIIANSMIISINPGAEIIFKNNGFHNFFCFNKKIVFTDSGGFQVMRPFFKKINNDEIEFTSPFDNSLHKISPISCIENQIKINSDIAMMLDHMPLFGAEKEQVIESMNRTFEWAKIQRKLHIKLKQENKSDQNLFGIIQGGYDLELRKKALKDIISLNFDGYALGGLAIGETREEMYNVFSNIIPMMPKNKLRYIMGVGNPVDILEAVESGADCFDSVYPTQNARHNHLFTDIGVIKLTQSKYKDDSKPIDEFCGCFVCKNYSKKILRHLTKIDEPIAYQLKTYHNIYWMQKFMEKIQKSIQDGDFLEFKKKYTKLFSKE